MFGLLLLLTYAAHIAEERWGGMGFPAWVSLHTGLVMTTPVWFRLNVGFYLAMAGAVVAGWLSKPAQWLLLPLATVVLINGMAHLVTSVLTLSYSPGLVTGVLLWIPLGIAILRAGRPRWPRPAFLSGIGLGVVLHIIVPLTAYLATRGR